MRSDECSLIKIVINTSVRCVLRAYLFLGGGGSAVTAVTAISIRTTLRHFLHVLEKYQLKRSRTGAHWHARTHTCIHARTHTHRLQMLSSCLIRPDRT